METYERYNAVRGRVKAELGDSANYVPEDIKREAIDTMKIAWQELGVFARQPNNYRAETASELRYILARLASGGFRTAIYLHVGGLHAVGVQQLDEDTYTTISTWSPFRDEAVSVSLMFDFLDQPARQRAKENSSRKTYKLWNIFALPPEDPRLRPPTPHV